MEIFRKRLYYKKYFIYCLMVVEDLMTYYSILMIHLEFLEKMYLKTLYSHMNYILYFAVVLCSYLY
jgi:hypothetical protein